MLPRPLRLRRSADIRRLTTNGRRFVSPYFTAYYHTTSSGSTKAAVVVGKRVHKSAVVRHRYQRWFRALLRQSISTLPMATEVVIVGRPVLLQLKNQRQLYSHWQAFLEAVKKHHHSSN